MVDPIIVTIMSPAIKFLLENVLEAASTKKPINRLQKTLLDVERMQLKKLVEETKGVFDKEKGLDIKLLKDLAGPLAVSETYGDTIKYFFKHELYCDMEQLRNEVVKLLEKLQGLNHKLPENQSRGHKQESEIPPGNVRRCLLYLSLFPKGFVYNCKRITRLFIAHEFIAADSGKPPLQQHANWLEVAESSWDGEIVPNYILIGNDVGKQTETWPQSCYCREIVDDSIDRVRIDGRTCSPSLVLFGGRKQMFKFKEGEFFLLRVLSLRNVKLENENYLKKLSFLKHLDLKYTDVRDCSWLEGLEELQLLDLRHTPVEEIPDKCLEKLGKLQHLLLGYPPNKDDNRLAGAKLNIQKLMTKNLETLRAIREPKWEPKWDPGSVLKVVDLSVTGFNTKNLKNFLGNNVSKFENLTSLGVAMTGDSLITLQDFPDELKAKLKRLRMEGQFSDSSTSAPPHSELAKLCEFENLIDLTLASHKPIDIDRIPSLPKLLCLRLYSSCTIETLTFGKKEFNSLKKLVIGNMTKVETVQIPHAVIEAVATFKLCNLPKFRELVCLKSKKGKLSKGKLDFNEFNSTKTIFLKDTNYISKKSPHLKVYCYDKNLQCYKEVN